METGLDLPSAPHRHVEVDFLRALDRLTELEVRVVPQTVEPEEGGKVLDQCAPRPIEREPIEGATGDDASAIDETGAGDEVIRNTVQLVVESPASAGAIELGLPHRTAAGDTALLGPAIGQLRLEEVEPREDNVGVSRDDPVVVSPPLAVGDGDAGGGRRAEVIPKPADVEDGVAIGRVIHGGEIGGGELAELAGELAAGDRIANLPRIHQLVGCGEEFDALEKEGSLLLEEECEPFVDGDLTLIGFDGAEIGVDGGVDGEVGEAETQVATGVRFDVAALEAAGHGVPLAGERGGGIGLDFDDDTALEFLESGDGAALGQKAGAGPASVGPGVLVAVALGDADDVEAPGLGAGGGDSQALEGNAHLHHVPGVGGRTLRVPGVIGAQVLAATEQVAGSELAFAANAVGLAAERVDREHERAPLVIEGVEQQGDAILIAEVVAVGLGRPDAAGVAVVGDDAEVDRCRRIPHQHVGLLLRRPAIHWPKLAKAAEARGLAPYRLVQPPINYHSRFDARDGRSRGRRADGSGVLERGDSE